MKITRRRLNKLNFGSERFENVVIAPNDSGRNQITSGFVFQIGDRNFIFDMLL
jgi:hypothetical protein